MCQGRKPKSIEVRARLSLQRAKISYGLFFLFEEIGNSSHSIDLHLLLTSVMLFGKIDAAVKRWLLLTGPWGHGMFLVHASMLFVESVWHKVQNRITFYIWRVLFVLHFTPTPLPRTLWQKAIGSCTQSLVFWFFFVFFFVPRWGKALWKCVRTGGAVGGGRAAAFTVVALVVRHMRHDRRHVELVRAVRQGVFDVFHLVHLITVLLFHLQKAQWYHSVPTSFVAPWSPTCAITLLLPTFRFTSSKLFGQRLCSSCSNRKSSWSETTQKITEQHHEVLTSSAPFACPYIENTGENKVLHKTVLDWFFTAFLGFLILVPGKTRRKLLRFKTKNQHKRRSQIAQGIIQLPNRRQESESLRNLLFVTTLLWYSMQKLKLEFFENLDGESTGPVLPSIINCDILLIQQGNMQGPLGNNTEIHTSDGMFISWQPPRCVGQTPKGNHFAHETLGFLFCSGPSVLWSSLVFFFCCWVKTQHTFAKCILLLGNGMWVPTCPLRSLCTIISEHLSSSARHKIACCICSLPGRSQEKSAKSSYGKKAPDHESLALDAAPLSLFRIFCTQLSKSIVQFESF